MAKSLVFKTIKPINDKAFTILEIMVVFFIISMLVVPFSSVAHISKISRFQNKSHIELIILQTQYKAIALHTTMTLSFRVNNNHVTFNEFGNINQSMSGRISSPYNNTIVFYLGYGRYEIQ